MSEDRPDPIQPVSGTKVPRYAGPSTFCRLPELRDVPYCDVAILGVPFDSGTSYRPGARFGPQAIRQASRHLRFNFHPAYETEPFKTIQVADAGDVACNPYNIDEAISQIEVALLRGENSELITQEAFEKMKETLPNALSAVVKDRAHVPFLDEPEAIDILKKWVKRLA